MADLKQRIAKRCAKEFKDGEFANLGIGLPTMVADYIPDDIVVTFHSENGFAGIDAMADASNVDVDIINSGGSYVTAVDRVKYFDTAESLRSGKRRPRKATVLGAMEVAENGDLANWIVPGKKVAGMGGAMDLCTGCPEVIIVMLHTNKGKPQDPEKMFSSADSRKMCFKDHHRDGRYGSNTGRYLGN